MFSLGSDLTNTGGTEAKFLVRLTRQEIAEIEGRRAGDVNININLAFRYFLAPGGKAQAFYQGTQLEISEGKWLKLLEALGYESGWVLEVLRPKIQGWERPVSHLQAARERIASHDAQGAVAECRAAWDSVDPLLKGAWESVEREMDRGSTPESGFPPKSARVKSLREWAERFSHTGAHPESFNATMEDALLAYRMTASLLSYLSVKVVQADRNAPKP